MEEGGGENKEGKEQKLRAAKVAARRAPRTTAATQTMPPPPMHSSSIQTGKPTYVSVATQADSGKKEKVIGKVGEPAPTIVASASAVDDIEMKPVGTHSSSGEMPCYDVAAGNTPAATK